MIPDTINLTLETALQHQQAGRFSDAEGIYRQVLAVHPEHPDAMYLLGSLIGQKGQIDIAIQMIERAISIDPAMPEYHCAAGEFYGRQKKVDAAISAFEKAIALDANFGIAYFNLGLARAETGDIDGAIIAYQKAVGLGSNTVAAYTNLGTALRRRGRLDEAVDAFRKAIAARPDAFEVHNNLANALAAQRRFEEAIGSYREAIRLKPELFEVHLNLGITLALIHRNEEAVAAFARAVQLNTADFNSWFGLGNALKDCGRTDDAIAAYGQAIRIKPVDAGAYANLSIALRHKGQLDQAVAAALKALELNPKLLQAMNNLANLYKEQGRLDDAITCLKKAVQTDPGFVIAGSNLAYSIYFHPDYDAAMIRDENVRWAQRHETPLKAHIREHANNRSKHRRLKIGYVSAELYGHPLAGLLATVVSHHNPENVEIVFYASVRKPDQMTDRMRKLSHLWRDVLAMTDEEVASQIRADGIDILVDLTLHMSGSRLLTFARKPAPIQVTWLGYPGTTGLSSMDYRLTDPYMDPPGEGDDFYTERSIRLPHSFWCYKPMLETAGVNPLPALQAGHMTFGCLNYFAKVTPPALELWSRVLNAVPGSRMIILSMPGRHRDATHEVFRRNGIEPQSIEFVDRMSQMDYFQAYHRIDLCLDPIPCPGHTSSLDALWMGVPSVTLAGRTAISRGGASILINMRLMEMIAHSHEEYVAIATRVAGDLPALSSLRAALRQRMLTSPLMDGRQFAADLEEIFRRIWIEWCG